MFVASKQYEDVLCECSRRILGVQAKRGATMFSACNIVEHWPGG